MQLLIAHRDIAVRGALAEALACGRDERLEVIESDEGMEALELLLEEDAPRLAVVDWDMPGLDGPELCRLVRDFHLGGPPYIVRLADDSHPDIEPGLEAGANDCIRTPAQAAEIRDRVEAGWSFVKVPWERASRAAMLDAVCSPDADDEACDAAEVRGANLEAVCSSGTDDEAADSHDAGGATLDALRSTDDDLWGGPEGKGVVAASRASRHHEAHLLSLLN